MNAQDARPALAEGSQIGVYEIRESIGRDLLSLSYEAWNHHLNAPVLLREYFPLGLALRSADGTRLEALSNVHRERYANGLCEFLYEAERLADIEQDTVAKVFNALEFNNTGYQVMALERDPSLAVWIESAYTFKLDELKGFFERLLTGLEAVHANGLVHGRICPESIRLREDGCPVLVDFSGTLLQYAREEGEFNSLLREGYAPIEQYEAEHVPAQSDDLYALAATFHHCITDRCPLSSFERLERLRRGERDPLSLLESVAENEIEARWLNALDWMLRPDAQDRPHGAKQVRTFLAGNLEAAKPGTGAAVIRESGSWFRSLFMDIRTLGAAVAIGFFAIGILWMNSLSVSKVPETRVATADSASGKTADARMQNLVAMDRAGIPASADNAGSRADSEIFMQRSEAPSFAALEEESGEPIPMSSGLDSLRATESFESEPDETERPLDTDHHVAAAAASELERPIEPEQLDSAQLASVIAGHLSMAEKNLLVFNLTTPRENNAYSGYQAILALDPDNSEALRGIGRVVKRYEWLIASALAKGEFKSAEVYLTRAESIARDPSSLEALRSRLEKARNTPPTRR